MLTVRGNQSIMSDREQRQQQQRDEIPESRDSNYVFASSAAATRDPLAGPYARNAERRIGHRPVRKFNGRNARDQWCRHCNVAIENRAQYWNHKRAHMDPGRLKACPSCDFVTYQNTQLEQHMTFHSAVKPLTCSRCDYRCASKSMLKSHFKMHLDVYLYRCDVCPFRSKYNNSWHAHLKSKRHTLSVIFAATQHRQQDRGRRPVDTAPQQPDRTETTATGTAHGVASTVVAAAAAAVPVPPPTPPQCAGKSWRKGAAFKFWRHRGLETGTDDDKMYGGGKTKQLVCKLCDVEFAGIVLYVKHMGFHCFGEPLTCNLCGEVMNDTPSFLSHVSRVSAHN